MNITMVQNNEGYQILRVMCKQRHDPIFFMYLHVIENLFKKDINHIVILFEEIQAHSTLISFLTKSIKMAHDNGGRLSLILQDDCLLTLLNEKEILMYIQIYKTEEELQKYIT